MAALMLLQGGVVAVSKEGIAAETTKIEELYDSDTYREIEAEYEQNGYKNAVTDDINVVLETATCSTGKVDIRTGIANYQGNALYWDEAIEWYEFTIEIPESGRYNIEVEYYLTNEKATYAERSLLIDGQLPFQEASSVRFTQYYQDAYTEKIYNNLGDQLKPKQSAIREWHSTKLIDNQGYLAMPFAIYFEKGVHKIRLQYVNDDMAIRKISLTPPETLQKYEEIEKQYQKEGYRSASKEIKFQAEDNVIKRSSPTLRPEYAGDPILEPSSCKNVILNTIGGDTWGRGNESITWEFEVEESGLYKLTLRDAQAWVTSSSSYRQISIDGAVPFEEMAAYGFEYSRDWRKETISDSDGNPYLFYLSEGTHTITMTAKLGKTVNVTTTLSECSGILSAFIRKVVLITGNNPDLNYEYELEKTIPDLYETLQSILDKLQYCVDEMNRLSDKNSSNANSIKTYISQIEHLVEKPDDIPKSLSDLNNALAGFGNIVLDLQYQYFGIDWFQFSPIDQEIVYDRSGLFAKFKSTVINFFYSFIKDYNAVGSILGDSVEIIDTIEVWTTRGKDSGELVKELADEQFTTKTGIAIDINILPSSGTAAVDPLMLAINSGKAPDICLGQAASKPSEYAFREAVADLTQFENFEDVKQRFSEQVMVPFNIEGKIYALPETINFMALYYRKDIIKDLGINLPETWDELRDYVLPILNQNSMQFSLPASYDMFLYQHGGRYYNEEGSKSALDSPEAYAAFKEMCEMFTNYGIPISANFFNRFRTGEMPIGISDGAFYTQLSVSAPELNGLWDIALIPGTMLNGELNRTVGASCTTAAIMLNASNKKESAWKFLDWWTSDSVQNEYAVNIEAKLGIGARWYSANLNAFLNLPWKPAERKIIKEELNWIQECPVFLGSYFSSRHISNAYNRTVISNMNARDSIEQAVKDINKELKRKQEQFGVYKGNE